MIAGRGSGQLNSCFVLPKRCLADNRRLALYTMTPAKLRLAQAAMATRDTKVGDLCKELGVTRQTLYRFVGPKGELRSDGAKLLDRKRSQAHS